MPWTSCTTFPSIRSMQGMIMRRLRAPCSRHPPDGDAGLLQRLFQLLHGVSAVVENGSREGGVGLAFGQDLDEVLGLAGAAGGDDGNAGGARDGARQGTVEAVLHAIGIHRSQQDLARSERFAARGPRDRVDAFVDAPAPRDRKTTRL